MVSTLDLLLLYRNGRDKAGKKKRVTLLVETFKLSQILAGYSDRKTKEGLSIQKPNNAIFMIRMRYTETDQRKEKKLDKFQIKYLRRMTAVRH